MRSWSMLLMAPIDAHVGVACLHCERGLMDEELDAMALSAIAGGRDGGGGFC